MIKYLIRSVVFVALYALSHAASAAVITYDFSQNSASGLEPYRWFQGSDGSWVKATAQYNGTPESPNGLGVVQGYGLYVCSESPCGSTDDNGQDRYPIDGDDIDEGVKFQFYNSAKTQTKNVDLRLLSVEFFVYDTHQNSYNSAELRSSAGNETLVFATSCTKTYYNSSGDIYTCDFTAGTYSQSSLVNEFSLWANWNKDAFKVRKLVFDVPGKQVPEPAGLALLGASLIGLFAAARVRRRRVAA